MTSVFSLAKTRFVWFLFAGVLLIAQVPSILGSYWTLIALNLMMWVAMTQSWTLFSGMTGYISLGHVVLGMGFAMLCRVASRWTSAIDLS